MFQFTHPGRGATRLETEVLKLWMVSIHAPREGCDFSRVRFSVCALEFQFTHPGRGATLMYNTIGYDYDVSIHAPREGCDQKVEPYNGRFGVSIHAPREGCDQVAASLASSSEWFQFTHPGRGATFGEPIKVTSGFRFNSRTPGGVRRKRRWRGHLLAVVSIHAPREGCDFQGCSSLEEMRMFQFTHPGRGATRASVTPLRSSTSFNSRTPGGVRLHTRRRQRNDRRFNSRTPGGVRRRSTEPSDQAEEFQFTHPGRGATTEKRGKRTLKQFQFTHPGRGATQSDKTDDDNVRVSIHAPREGCDYRIHH